MRPWIDEGRMPTPDEMRADRKRLRELFHPTRKRRSAASTVKPGAVAFGPYLTQDMILWLVSPANRGMKATTVDQVLDVCAAYHGLDRRTVMSRIRRKDIILVRHMAAYVALGFVDFRLPLIGKKLGGFDQASVRYSYERIEKMLTKEHDAHKAVSDILALCGLPPVEHARPLKVETPPEFWEADVELAQSIATEEFGVDVRSIRTGIAANHHEMKARYACVLLTADLPVQRWRMTNKLGYAKCNYGKLLTRARLKEDTDAAFGETMRKLYRKWDEVHYG